MDEKARKQAFRPESGFRKRAAMGYALQYRQGVAVLTKIETTIGRSTSCEVVLESALVSRRHARILMSDAGLFIEDLGSRNGIIVNGTLVRGSARLSVGDRLRIGAEILELIEQPGAATSEAPPADRRATDDKKATLSGAPADAHFRAHLAEPAPSNSVPALDDAEPEDDATRRADILELLSNTVDKSFAYGKGQEAERLLSGHLTARLQQARRGSLLPPEMVTRAARYGVRLAAVTEKPSWLDYVIELYTALAQPLPLPIVDEMYALLRKVRGMDRALLREYVSVLRKNAERYTPEERFALQRVEGLERLAAL
ncbi:MAG TPA: FHA domain-containing protein [Polyangiaceae bacterium]|nr:FHA domain-containing protein [Polyangiaceae bacterium]